MNAKVINEAGICRDILHLLPLPTGYFLLENDVYKALYVNDAFSSLLGITGDEAAAFLSGDLLPLIHRNDADRISLLLYKGSVGGGIYHDTARILAANGRYKWVDICFNMALQAGENSILCLVLTDIDTRLKRQKSLDRTYSKLLGVMDNVPGGIIVFDTINNRELIPSYISQGMEKLLMGSAADIMELYRHDPSACIHPDDRENLIRIVEDALRNLSGFQQSVRLMTVKGDYILASVSGTVENADNQRTLYMAVMDTSADTENLYIQKQILDVFVRKQYEHICFIDGRHNTYQVLGSNDHTDHTIPFLPAGGTDFETDMHDLIMKNVIPEEREHLAADFRLKALFDRLEDRGDIDCYCTLTDENNVLRYKKIWLSWIDKETKSIALVSSDITEEHTRSEETRATLHAALLAAEQANAAKSEFLSRMSHDIRTPLNAIIGYTDMSLENGELHPDVREYLLKAEASSKYLLSLISDILNMSRIESGKLVLNENIFSIDDFLNGISSIVSTQCSAGKIKYMCRRGNNLHSLYEGASLKLQQILINLIGNSIKFTPENGSISLDADEVMLNDSPFVRFIVTDNGCGISKEFIPYLFDSFSQEKRLSDGEIKGSGLGLAICRSLAAMMGGNITVSSEVGRGSEFTVFVKLRCIDSDSGPQPKNDEIKEKEQDIIDFRGCRVLLAEDNDLNMEIARHVLENANLIVDTAENGQAAVERFCASSAGYYTAILMDIRMPVLNGLEATAIIRSSGRPDSNVPIIAMSANAFEEDIREATDCGMNAYTTKPIDVQLLYSTLSKFI